jgi:hypothetical protein
MQQTHERLLQKQAALTFRSLNDVLNARDFSFPDFDTVYVGDSTLIVPAEELQRYQLLHPVVSEVLQAEVLQLHRQATPPREHVIFEASAGQQGSTTQSHFQA